MTDTKGLAASTVWQRTHSCGALRAKDEGQLVVLSGWIARRRDHGQLVFLDLRDRFGLTQAVIDPAATPYLIGIIKELRNECVLSVEGTVCKRPDGMVNAGMPTGAVEVQVNRITLYNRSAVLPFPVSDQSEASEHLRLKHRYLDLRRPVQKERLIARSRITSLIRKHLGRARIP